LRLRFFWNLARSPLRLDICPSDSRVKTST
jgi:hypothetical protein